jgi:nicotinamidase-related amidase
MSEFNRYYKLLKTNTTALLIIDVQERILPVINNYHQVVNNVVKLIKGFKVMGLPIYLTEQYPKGLGPTIQPIINELDEQKPIEKMSFSCSGAAGLFDEFKSKKLTQIVVTGIEAHVCVQQTVHDLLESGFQVNLAADAVSSRKEFDFRIALERMKSNGAEVTTSESILFELLNVCGTDVFKQVSKIVK